LGVDAPATEVRTHTIEAVISGDAGPELHEVPVPEGAAADGQPVVALDLPAGTLIVLLQRGDGYVVPEGRTIVRAGDRLLVLAEGEALGKIRRAMEQR